jgi:DNA-binding NarL/FixJ family response regulator
MQALFLSSQDGPRPRWLSAFPDLKCFSAVSDIPQSANTDALVWLNLEALSDAQSVGDASDRSSTQTDGATDQAVESLVAAGHKVIALSAYPGEAQAFALLSKGVRGYCHVDAAPQQLLQVAEAVAGGALWMPPELVQRLASVGQRIDSPAMPGPKAEDHFAVFTPREERVALMVGRGFNNREIAAALEISERTVKAHLTTIFEKLGLRDRVQLALYVNRLPIH